MEPTYYWDGLSRDALDWLNRNTPPGKTVRFASYPTSWLYLHQTGQLRPGVLPTRASPPAWYVVQNRPGSFSALDHALALRGRPSHVVRKWGVPLVWIFADGEVERVLKSEEGARKSTPAQENHSGASSRRGP